MADLRERVDGDRLTLHAARLRLLAAAAPQGSAEGAPSAGTPAARTTPAVLPQIGDLPADDGLLTAALPIRARLAELLRGGAESLVLCDHAARVLLAAGTTVSPSTEGRILAVPGLAGPVGLFAPVDQANGVHVACPVLHPETGRPAGLVEVQRVPEPAVPLASLAAWSSAQLVAQALRKGRGSVPSGRLPVAAPGAELVGGNPGWLAAVERAARAARTDSTVLITGETGTGKEVLALSIHRASARRGGPFQAVNCGALPPSLAASELFGYVGGAFTGANPRGSPGKVEAAEGGTLFLDEVSELAPEVQVALLRLLQEREIVRVGGRQPVPVNIRVIAATNRDLSAMVAAGSFRQDLFFRLNVVPIRIPPLRERREDILPLVEHAYRRLGCQPPSLGLATCERLTAHSWPGNVRELFNLVEQAVALQENPADLLPLPPLAAGSPGLGEPGEEERIRQALSRCGGNAAAAARTLGMGRSTLYRKLELYGIRLRRQVD